MSRTAKAFVEAALILDGVTIGVCELHAAPPTVVPSPGYDARLQESRPAPMAAPPAPAPVYFRHRQRPHAHRRHR